MTLLPEKKMEARLSRLIEIHEEGLLSEKGKELLIEMLMEDARKERSQITGSENKGKKT